MRANQDSHGKLMDKLSRLEDRMGGTGGGGRRAVTVEVVTNVNVFLYAACYFIQTGTLPVTSRLPFQRGRKYPTNVGAT